MKSTLALVALTASAASAQFLYDADLRGLYARAESHPVAGPPVIDEKSYAPPVPYKEDLHQIVVSAASPAGNPSGSAFLFGAMHPLTMNAQGSAGGDTNGAGPGQVGVLTWSRFAADFHLDVHNDAIITAQLTTSLLGEAWVRLSRDGNDLYFKKVFDGGGAFVSQPVSLDPGDYTFEMYAQGLGSTGNWAGNKDIFAAFNGSLHSFAPAPGAGVALALAGLLARRRRGG